MTVVPCAVSAAIISTAPARKSKLVISFPSSGVGPVMSARCGSHMNASAPMRFSSSTYFNLPSYIQSWIKLIPRACVINTTNIGRMSGDSPGYGILCTFFTATNGDGITSISAISYPHPCAFFLRFFIFTITPASANFNISNRINSGTVFLMTIRLFVQAASVMNVPISIGSGMIKCLTPCNFATPLTISVLVPMPEM